MGGRGGVQSEIYSLVDIHYGILTNNNKRIVQCYMQQNGTWCAGFMPLRKPIEHVARYSPATKF